MSEPRGLLLVGKVRPERKRSLTGMAVAAELPLVAIEEPTQALEWLETNDPGCLLLDAGVGRLDKLIAKLRSKRQLSHVPVLALVSAPDDLWIEQYFSWGGDDVVHVEAGSTLLERLRAVPREPPRPHPNRLVVIADPDKARTDVIGRSFAQAGFDTNSAIDRRALEFYIQQHQPELVIANCILGELPELIARTRQGGSRATWIVTAARRELEAQQQALATIDRCAVMGIQVSPWQLLYRANELARDSGDERRCEVRRPFGSFVLFRAAGSDDDDVGVAFNLSSRGMFIRTFAPVLSEDVWLEWRVPQDKTRVRLEGRVVWRQASLTNPERAASPMGFGVEFCDYLGGARKHLERALEVLDGGARRGSGASALPDGALSKQARDSKPPAAGDGTATRTSSVPPAGETKSASPKPGASVPPTAMAGSSKSPPQGTTRLAPSVRPLTNLGAMGKPPAPRVEAKSPEPKSREVAAPKATVAAKTESKPQAPTRDKPKGVPAGTSENLAVTKRVAPPTGAPAIKPQVGAVKVPPRPVSEPPRPDRPLGTDGASAPKTDEAQTTDGSFEPKVRRSDTLRNDQAFDDLIETTDPDARHELLEEGPTSSEPTEILTNPTALFGAEEEPKHPLYRASDDAPTVVVQNPIALDRSPEAGAVETGPQPEEPPSARVAESFFGAEEQVTKQWHAQEAAAVQTGLPGLDDEPSRPRPRRGGAIFVVGFVLVAAAVAGVGLWLRASGTGSPTRSPGVPASKPSAASAASAASSTAGLPSPSASSLAAPDAAAPGPSASASPDGIPWAKVDDGTGLENYPPVEDPQGGKGRLLADRYGYLVVRFPEAAYLFSNNIAVGATNWKIALPCGEKLLRVGVGEKPVIWLSQETRVNIECRGLTRVVFDRLPGVVVPPGTQRPIAPGSLPARKTPEKPTEGASDRETPSGAEKHETAPEPKPEAKPAEGERGVVDTRE